MTANGRTGEVLAFAHIGDLHVTYPQLQNFRDLLSILVQIEVEAASQLDFVVLPGDCADNGKPGQYALIATALKMLSVPVHVIPGDHDMEPKSLRNFHEGLQAEPLPKSLPLKGYRNLFLDLCSHGTGGPDFRLGDQQLAWLERELATAGQTGEIPLVFMHSYPADLQGEGEHEAVTRLFKTHQVALVDMGHTHYNEISNDGTTLYTATRSTGQIDEGPVGYSLTTVDAGVVSWRFRPLDDPFPFVMITTPADHRLTTGLSQPGTGGSVGARVFGREAVDKVECQIGDGTWAPMRRQPDGQDWRLDVEAWPDGLFEVTVRAFTAGGRPGVHVILAAGAGHRLAQRKVSGSDAAAIGAWPENGIFGTQLGPNKNGTKW